MKGPACAPAVHKISGSPHIEATIVSDPPSPGENISIFAGYENSSSISANAFTIQSKHQKESESLYPNRLFSPVIVLDNPNDAQFSSPKRDTQRIGFWKTVWTIIGFFLIALFAALAHYVLVTILNGKPVDTSFLTQTQASAVFILLTTTFKASLTASMGTCFAQHLWYILRGTAMSLSTIEMLFMIRANILALFDPRRIWRAPLLFLMALLVWSLGIATIYPPGALTVVFEAQEFTKNHNMSVMNPPVPPNLDLATTDSFPMLSYYGFENICTDNISSTTCQSAFREWSYQEPTPELMYLAQANTFNNQILTLPGHPGENSTYNLQFRGPHFKCTTSQYNSTIALQSRVDTLFITNRTIHRQWLEAPILTSGWDRERLVYSLEQYYPGDYTLQRDSKNSLVWNTNSVTKRQICEPVSALYNVSITFPRGVQKVEYSLSDAKLLPRKADIYDVGNASRGLLGLYLELPPETQTLQDWYRKISTALPVSNQWAILDALGTVLEGTCAETSSVPSLPFSSPDILPKDPSFSSSGKCKQEGGLPGSTIIYDCGSWQSDIIDPTSRTLLRGSVFHTGRYDSTQRYYRYDPRRSLNLTEAMLNDVLANITISAISLGTWWDMVPVTSIRYRSTYTLSSPLNLILPYSICLVAATVFIGIAIWSLYRNHAPAADGGFLQIMMATAGNTKMSRIILNEGAAAIDDMSDELKSLKIRYGELVNEDMLGAESKRYGFGTAEEIVLPRKRR